MHHFFKFDSVVKDKRILHIAESSFVVCFQVRLIKDNLPTFHNGGRSGDYQLTKKKITLKQL